MTLNPQSAAVLRAVPASHFRKRRLVMHEARAQMDIVEASMQLFRLRRAGMVQRESEEVPTKLCRTDAGNTALEEYDAKPTN